MVFSPLFAKIVGFILALLTPLLSFIFTDIKGPFETETEAALERVGGYMKGVCHAEPQYDLIKEGNIEWFRDDIPFPYDAEGKLSESYLSWMVYVKG